MSFRQPDAAYRRILGNRRNSVKLRLAALKAMSKPSIRFLYQLENDPDTPDKLRFAITQRREVEMALQKRLNEQRNPSPDRQ